MKKLGFELSHLPLKIPDDNSTVDIESVKKLVDDFLNKGFTYFKTEASWHQGNSETAFCEAVVRRYHRFAYTVADKLDCAEIHDELELKHFFDRQLNRLGLEYIDYYFIQNSDGQWKQKEEETDIFAFLQEMKKQRIVRHIGLEFKGKPETLYEILSCHPELEYIQLSINYLDWSDQKNLEQCYQIALKHRKPVIAEDPVKRYSLLHLPEQVEMFLRQSVPEQTPESLAVRFAASPPGVMAVLAGFNSLEKMEEVTGYMEKFQSLDSGEREILSQAAEMVRQGYVRQSQSTVS